MVWYAYYATLYLFTDTLLIASCLLEYKDIKDLPTSRIKRLVPDFSSKPLVSSNTINSIQQNSPKQKNSPYFCNCFRTSRNPFCLFGCKDKARGKSCSNSSSNNDISWINVTEQKLQNLTKGPIQKRNQRHIHNDAPLLKLSTTIGTIRQYRRPVLPGSNITVKYKECGFIFCYAEDFFLNHSVQRWDYHVEWTIPNHVSQTVGPNRVFVLGNNFQLAHAYLVFRRFDRTYEGIYSCHLSFFGTVVLRADVALVFSETESEKQCVSCPGVWLPGRGRLSLSLCLLGFHTRTGRLAPIFPIMFHEKFKFDRTFVGVTNLGVLERVLESETVYLELMQEEPSGETVLAVFESSVRDLLFPRPAERLSYSGNDLDLLMEPTRDFPGIISPKIEVSTKTVVGETRTPMHQCMQDNVSFGHSQNKAIKATYQPISGKEAGKDDEENNPTNLDAESRNKAVAFESHSECSKRGNDLISGAGPKPPFAYKRPERNLLARLPESPTRNNRYLGIKSRYLSRSTGNISDLTKPSLYSRYGANKSSRQSRRRRFTDDDGHNTRVTLVEPERCPHCYEEHGAESCTTCRTYHRYFPRPDHPRPHLHAHAYHARPRYGAGGLKILKQPAYRNGRQRKRYLVDIGGADDGETFGASDERASLTRRPSSAPLTRFESTTGISADEEDDDEEDDDAEEGEVEEKEKEETKLKKPKDFSKKLSHSRSVSRSPSPPSHASAPPVLARSHYLDSDDDYLDDYTYLPRRYRYPYYKSLPRYCSYGYECPLCEQGSSRYYRRMLRDPDWCFYPKMKSYHTEPLHSKETCPICYKYNLYKPYFTYRYPSKWDPYWYKPFNLGIPPPFYRDDSCCIPFNDSDDEGRLTSWRRRRSHLRCGRKKHNIDSADEILSDVYNNENYVSGRGRDGRSRKGKNAHSAKKMHVKEYKSNGDKED